MVNSFDKIDMNDINFTNNITYKIHINFSPLPFEIKINNTGCSQSSITGCRIIIDYDYLPNKLNICVPI